jgi:hypothetical protein
MKRYLIIFGTVALALAATAVLLIQGSKAASPGLARVRVAHAVPGGPGVDIYVDSTKVLTNITYTAVTPYQVLLAGPHQVQVTPSGLPPSPIFTLISATLVLTGGMDFTVAGVSHISGITAVVMADNNHPSNVNTVRLVHLSPDTPVIDVAITGTVTSTLISNILPNQASDYVGGIGAGDASFEVRPSGQITPLLPFTDTLDNNATHTFFIMGLKDALPESPLFLTKIHTVDQQFAVIFLPVVAVDEPSQ